MPPKTVKWEMTSTDILRQMDELCDEGWEPFATGEWSDGDGGTNVAVYFKRQVAEAAHKTSQEPPPDAL